MVLLRIGNVDICFEYKRPSAVLRISAVLDAISPSLYAVGYGLTEKQEYGEKRMTTLSAVTLTCSTSIGKKAGCQPFREFIASDTEGGLHPSAGGDTCEGDSGGPLFIKKHGRMVVVGITSRGLDRLAIRLPHAAMAASIATRAQNRHWPGCLPTFSQTEFGPQRSLPPNDGLVCAHQGVVRKGPTVCRIEGTTPQEFQRAAILIDRVRHDVDRNSQIRGFFRSPLKAWVSPSARRVNCAGKRRFRPVPGPAETVCPPQGLQH
ncbi:trypsin-like serine protease (plasmid) [Rhizobium ruizarguesonis]|nr:trypsin-like serine protease [Rhizobium ruizarguesonis]